MLKLNPNLLFISIYGCLRGNISCFFPTLEVNAFKYI